MFMRALSLRIIAPIGLLVFSSLGLRWYNSERGYVYQWDHSVENEKSHTRDLYALDGKQRGMNLLAIERFEETQLIPLLRNNVEWITLVPFAWQPNRRYVHASLVATNHSADWVACVLFSWFEMVQLREGLRLPVGPFG